MQHRLHVECLTLPMHPMPGTSHILEEAMAPEYGWMTCSALAVKRVYMTVPIATGVYIIVDTLSLLG